MSAESALRKDAPARPPLNRTAFMIRLASLAALTLFASTAHAQFQLAVPPASHKTLGAQAAALSVAPGATSFSGGSNCVTATTLPPGATITPIAFNTAQPAFAGTPTNPLAALCNFFGQTAIHDEEWYRWTATIDGVARLTTCGGLASVDTKIAVYDDDCAAITSLEPLACKDDTPRCTNLTTILSWNVVAGESYLIQLGNSATATPGASDFTIEQLPPRPQGQLDLGTTDNALALVSGGELLWLQVFDAGAGKRVTAVHTAFGTPNAFTAPDGQPCTVAVYAGTPESTLTLLATQAGVTSQTGTDSIVSFALSNPPFVSGKFSVAVVASVSAAHSIAPLDQTVNSKGRAWIASQDFGEFDLASPTNASTPPVELQSIQPGSFDGVFLLRAATLGSGEPFASLCNGDGGDQLGCTDCPCGNNSRRNTIGGCRNSVGGSARLLASGTDSVQAGDLRFEAVDAPGFSFGILTSGAALAPASAANPCFGADSGLRSAFLDGLRCVVQNTQRHGGRAAAPDGTFGVSSPGWGPPNGPRANMGGIPAHGGFAPGQTRHFQLTYRDFTTRSCATGLNTSQAISVSFTP